jgi:hypothetical protein
MEKSGNIRKMRTELADPVRYFLPVGGEEIFMNELIGSEVQMEFLGEIHCIRCGRKTSKSFAQGYCFPCFKTAPETEECVLHPEMCRAHEGVARDMNYAALHCLTDQVVYLSLTSGLKVGVTRSAQVPYRWIDQGAVSAVEIARTPNRYTAGLIEVFLKDHMDDKTNWRNMLKNELRFDGDLVVRKQEVLRLLPAELAAYGSSDDWVTMISYPVSAYPVKIGSLNPDKDPVVTGTLTGIKGQYLIFSDGKVINIRKYGGYMVRVLY